MGVTAGCVAVRGSILELRQELDHAARGGLRGSPDSDCQRSSLSCR